MATAKTGAAAALARHLLRRMLDPPGWPFHAVMTLVAAWLLWALGVPGFAVFTVMGLLVVLAAAATLWTGKATAFLVRRRRGTASGRAIRFLTAPVGAVVVAALAWGGVPFQARWAVSEGAFARVVEQVGAPATPMEHRDIDAPRRIGAYRILAVHRVGDAVIFHEPTGLLFDDTGFAYLPDGPFPELESVAFERPRFRHIEGPWYTWTASW